MFYIPDHVKFKNSENRKIIYKKLNNLVERDLYFGEDDTPEKIEKEVFEILEKDNEMDVIKYLASVGFTK